MRSIAVRLLCLIAKSFAFIYWLAWLLNGFNLFGMMLGLRKIKSNGYHFSGELALYAARRSVNFGLGCVQSSPLAGLVVRLYNMRIIFLFCAIIFAVALFFGVALGLSFERGWQLSIGEATSLFVAILAMVATSYQAWLTREHNRLQVQPLIMLEYPIEARPTIDGVHIVGCRLHNIGLGPADVRSVKFILNGKCVTGKELMDVLCRDTGIDVLYQRHKINCQPFAVELANGIYIKENQTFTLANIKFWPEEAETRASYEELTSAHKSAVEFIRNNLRVQAEYSSVYKEESKKIDSHDYNKEADV